MFTYHNFFFKYTKVFLCFKHIHSGHEVCDNRSVFKCEDLKV